MLLACALFFCNACGQDDDHAWAVDATASASLGEELGRHEEESALAVVAHPDDDLLFMSEFVRHALAHKVPLRVVYLTAGDAGRTAGYWRGREEGVRAAYGKMLGGQPAWAQGYVYLHAGRFAESRTEVEGAQVSLVFLRLPDGNTDGRGFKRTRKTSLARLWREGAGTLRAVDSATRLSKDRLQTALAHIFEDWRDLTSKRPRLGLLNCLDVGAPGEDHADHKAASLFAVAAAAQTGKSPRTFLHAGYDIRHLPQNLSFDQQSAKWDAFVAYTAHDGATLGGKRRKAPLAFYRHTSGREYAWLASGLAVQPKGETCEAGQATLLDPGR